MNSTLKYTIIAMATLALSLGAACSKDDTSVTAEETTAGAETIAVVEEASSEKTTEEIAEEVVEEAIEEGTQTEASVVN